MKFIKLLVFILIACMALSALTVISKPVTVRNNNSAVNVSNVQEGSLTELGQKVVFSSADCANGFGSSVDLSSVLEIGKHYEVFVVASYPLLNIAEDYTCSFSFDWDETSKWSKAGNYYTIDPDGTLRSESGIMESNGNYDYDEYGDSIGVELEVKINGVLVLEGTPVSMPYILLNSDSVMDCTEISGINCDPGNGFLFIKVLLWDKSENKYVEDYMLAKNINGTYCGYSAYLMFDNTMRTLTTKNGYCFVGIYFLNVPDIT